MKNSDNKGINIISHNKTKNINSNKERIKSKKKNCKDYDKNKNREKIVYKNILQTSYLIYKKKIRMRTILF